MSSPLVGTNALAVVRVFRSREEYLAYVGTEQKWTAAIWSPLRRELVLYLPESGTDKLLRTEQQLSLYQRILAEGLSVRRVEEL